MKTIEDAINEVVTIDTIRQYQGGKFQLMGTVTSEVVKLTEGRYEYEVVFGAVMRKLQENWNIPKSPIVLENERLKKEISDLKDKTGNSFDKNLFYAVKCDYAVIDYESKLYENVMKNEGVSVAVIEALEAWYLDKCKNYLNK